jgi:hypothetical protein
MGGLFVSWWCALWLKVSKRPHFFRWIAISASSSRPEIVNGTATLKDALTEEKAAEREENTQDEEHSQRKTEKDDDDDDDDWGTGGGWGSDDDDEDTATGAAKDLDKGNPLTITITSMQACLFRTNNIPLLDLTYSALL